MFALITFLFASLSLANSVCQFEWRASTGLTRVNNAINIIDRRIYDRGDGVNFAYFARTGDSYGYVRSDQPGMTGANLSE